MAHPSCLGPAGTSLAALAVASLIGLATGCARSDRVTPDASEKESPSAARPEASGDGSAAAASPRASCGRVSGEQARALVQKGATLLDVRSAGEFASGHLEGARLIPHDEVGRRKGELPSGAPVVVYCRSGRRSAAAATVLRGQGFEVYDLGGMSGWSTTGDACL